MIFYFLPTKREMVWNIRLQTCLRLKTRPRLIILQLRPGISFRIQMNLTLQWGYDLTIVKIVIIRIRLFHGNEILLNIHVFTRMVTAFSFRFWSDLAFCPSLKPKFRRIRSKCHPVVTKKLPALHIHVHSRNLETVKILQDKSNLS